MTATPNPFAREASDRTQVKTSFVAFPVAYEDRSWHTAAELREPLANSAHSTNPAHSTDHAHAKTGRPAIVVVHGSAGVDSRGKGYIVALNEAGFVTLEIDLWAARGVNAPQERPKTVVETLPDAFAALDFLAHRKNVDPVRIGIMGFSWGGIVSMLSATVRAPATFAKPGQRFAAHAPFYPVCWTYNTVPEFEFTELTGAPVFIQSGADDLYDDPESCAKLVASLSDKAKALVTFKTYAHATHAWDRKEPDITPNDPFAFKGKGGEVPFRYNEEVTRQATAAIVEFFTRVLRP